MIESLQPFYKPFWTHHTKIYLCSDRLMFPSNEELRYPLEQLMKLSIRASEPQGYEAESPPTACLCIRIHRKLFLRYRKHKNKPKDSKNRAVVWSSWLSVEDPYVVLPKKSLGSFESVSVSVFQCTTRTASTFESPELPPSYVPLGLRLWYPI